MLSKDLLFDIIEIAEGEWNLESFARFGCVDEELLAKFGSTENLLAFVRFYNEEDFFKNFVEGLTRDPVST